MAKYLVQHRRGTAEQWAAEGTLIPREGEIVIEIDAVNSLHKLKIGDGIHTYNELAYLQAGDEIVTQVLTQTRPRVVVITLEADKWIENTDDYSQVVSIDDITSHSRLDLQPDATMLNEFKNLGLIFVTENVNGVISVHSVGNKPTSTYTIQATIIETECIGQDVVVGIPVGTSVTQSDWSQSDETRTDYIKNKPNLGDVLRYTAQELTEEQQAQVRSNIGVGANSFSGNYDDLANKPELGALAGKSTVEKADLDSSIQGSLDKADTALQSYMETDPTVPAWAKEPTKPTYTADDVGAVSYKTQTLTEEQKAQARSNIGAGASAFSGSYNDLTDKPVIPSVEGLASEDYVDEKVATKVDKVGGKDLSTNDYTTADKNKLASIEDGANKIVVEDALTSTSTTNALSAAQGKILNDKIKSINDNLGDLGGGDMLRSVYDTDGDGIVEEADNAKKLNGVEASEYAKNADIPTNVSQLTNDKGYITEHQDISGKVDKVEGKSLSSNDYTDDDKNKLADIEDGANKTVVENVLTSSSSTKALSAAMGAELKKQIDSIDTNIENLGAGDMLKSTYDKDGNGKVDSADDADKLGGVAASEYAKNSAIPTKVSQLTNDNGYLTEHQDISGKVDKVDGKGLSTNDFTTDEKNKLEKLVVGAEANVQSDWNQTDNSSDDYIKNKPVLGTLAEKSEVAKTDLADDVQASLEKADNAVLCEEQSLSASQQQQVRANIGAAPAYTSGTTDLVAGTSELETGTLYFVYE